MALKLAEEQALRELQEAKEEEANNPMKLLENRTEQSRNEIELLESLEELKDLNQRHENIDYEALLHQYDPRESIQQREERLARLDEEYIKTIKFQGNGNSSKRVIAEEIIEDVKEEESDEISKKKPKIDSFAPKLPKPISNNKKPLVLVKKKEPSVATVSKASITTATNSSKNNDAVSDSTSNKEIGALHEDKAANESNKPSGLSLLCDYSDSNSDDDT